MSRREFHYSDAKSNKFWSIELKGTGGAYVPHDPGLVEELRRRKVGLASVTFAPADYALLSEMLDPASGDKLAGWPTWVQGVDYPSCRQCRKTMRLVCQLESNDNLPYMFGDTGTGYITQCPEHREQVGFSWQCG